MTRFRDNALAMRTQSLDLVPEGAYWRAPNRFESKIDLQRFEAEEGAALTRHRIVCGILFAEQAKEVLSWAKAAHGGSRRSLKVDRPILSEEFEREFTRLALRGYVEGALAVDSASARYASARAESQPNEFGAVLSSAGVSAIERRASRAGRAFAQGPIKEAVRVVEAASAVTGSGFRISWEELSKQIRSVYAKYIEVAELPSPIDLAAEPAIDIENAPSRRPRRRSRRMRVRNRLQYEAWQAQFIPYSKRIKLPLDEYVRRGRVPSVATHHAKFALLTNRSIYVNAGVIDRSLRDSEVAAFQFSSMRDDRVCEKCQRRDGIVRRKSDVSWNGFAPPLHFICRCLLIPILRTEKFRVTPKKDLPDNWDLPEGFGGYNPNRVVAQNRLGVRL